MVREILIKKRNEKQLTQKQVAEVLNISAIYVRKIEKGDRTPGRDVLFKFEKLYATPVRDLFPELFSKI